MKTITEAISGPISGRVAHFAIFEKLVFVITSRILRILMVRIESICSLEPNLFLITLCSISIFNILEVIAKTSFPKCSTLISDIIRLEDNFIYEKAPVTPVPTTPKLNLSNCSDMSMETESSCMTPGLMAKLKPRARTPLSETQNSPTHPIGMSTPAEPRRFFPTP